MKYIFIYYSSSKNMCCHHREKEPFLNMIVIDFFMVIGAHAHCYFK